MKIRWTDGEMQVVVAAIDDAALPRLDPGLVGRIRAMAAPVDGAVWELDVDVIEGQRLKAWCEARRERAVDQEPSDTWTRIAARVNEAVQPLAPATEPGSAERAGKPAGR